MDMKRFIATLLAVALLLAGTGCSADPKLDKLKTFIKSEGRDFGETVNFSQEDIMKTSFFDFKINSAKLVPAIGEFVPTEEDQLFLVVNVSIMNTFADRTTIPMFYDDFELTCASAGDSAIWCESKFNDSQLPDEYEIAPGESRMGNLIYVVPGGETDFTITFREYWDDDFEGNTMRIAFSAEK